MSAQHGNEVAGTVVNSSLELWKAAFQGSAGCWQAIKAEWEAQAALAV